MYIHILFINHSAADLIGIVAVINNFQQNMSDNLDKMFCYHKWYTF